MANFMGGSAPAMASQIGDGNCLLHKNALRGFTPADLENLKHELEKAQREARALVPPQDDAQASQNRNRRITRLGSAIQFLGSFMTIRR